MAHEALIADFESRRRKKDAAAPEETARELFRRALELERAIEAGQRVTPEQRKWLAGYQNHSDYRAEKLLWGIHGDAIFG